MITKPVAFPEAVGHLLYKEQLPAERSAAEWAAQEAAVKVKAFFSANVENARFLDRLQGMIFDYMAKVRDEVTSPSGVESTALRVSGRAAFVEQAMQFMVAEGLAKPEEFAGVNHKDVTDIRSLARLNLIFDTNVRQAYGYGQWKQGMTPSVLAAYPAARLIRDMEVKIPRLRHEMNLGEVRLKTDPWWADVMNASDIGGFGVPWGPYGYNSGCTQEDVSREDAQALGIDTTPQAPAPSSLLDGLRASVRDMDPELKRKLIDELQAGPKAMDPREAGRSAAAEVRKEMLNRGLADALGRGDAARAEKYREAIAELPAANGLTIREAGNEIILETPSMEDILPALPGHDFQNPNPEGSILPRPSDDRSIQAAIDDIGRVLRPNGALNGEADYLDRSEQFQRLEVEARKIGVLYDGLEPVAVGGREHDVTFDQVSETILKFTKPSSAAYVVDFINGKPFLSNADPLEYLDRLKLCNDIFGDLNQFVGIGGIQNFRRIITRQPIIKGSPASWNDIAKLMENELGFTKLRHNYGIGYEDSWGYVRDDIVVFDLRPANVFRQDSGEIIVIDCIAAKLDPNEVSIFR